MENRWSDVTVVVVPRERFSMAQESLASIYEHSPGLTNLIYVDGASPGQVRIAIAAAATEHGFLHIRFERYLSPNEARNAGLRLVRTRFVVFVDNDVVVAPGWLNQLVDCAHETGAAIVGPLYQIAIGDSTNVHMAGGDAHIREEDGKRICIERHHLAGAASPAGILQRRECELVEFHTMLVRMELFERTGLLDEALLSVNEHVDFCMIARELGEAVFFEPRSVVTYVPATRLCVSDLHYFMLRWSERWNHATSRHFNAKWQLDPRHSKNHEIVRHGRYHRQRALGITLEPGVATWIERARRRAATTFERHFNYHVLSDRTRRRSPR